MRKVSFRRRTASEDRFTNCVASAACMSARDAVILRPRHRGIGPCMVMGTAAAPAPPPSTPFEASQGSSQSRVRATQTARPPSPPYRRVHPQTLLPLPRHLRLGLLWVGASTTSPPTAWCRTQSGRATTVHGCQHAKEGKQSPRLDSLRRCAAGWTAVVPPAERVRPLRPLPAGPWHRCGARGGEGVSRRQRPDAVMCLFVCPAPCFFSLVVGVCP